MSQPGGTRHSALVSGFLREAEGETDKGRVGEGGQEIRTADGSDGDSLFLKAVVVVAAAGPGLGQPKLSTVKWMMVNYTNRHGTSNIKKNGEETRHCVLRWTF